MFYLTGNLVQQQMKLDMGAKMILKQFISFTFTYSCIFAVFFHTNVQVGIGVLKALVLQ